MKYLVEIVGPFVLKLKIDGDVKNIEAMKDRYVVLNRELRGLENYTVSPYNNEKEERDGHCEVGRQVERVQVDGIVDDHA